MDSEQIAVIMKQITTGTIVEIIIVIAIVIGLSWIVEKVLPWIAEKLHSRRRLLILALIPTIRILLFILALIWIVPLIIEPTWQNMIAILSAVGVAVGFALKDYVSSILAGIVAAYELPYRPGDWIEVNGNYGEVKHIGTRVITIVTPDDTVVYIPHLKIWTELIHNANNHTPNLLCVANFYLDPDHNPKQICRILKSVALTSPYTNLAKAIIVLLEDKPWGTHYRIKAYPMDPRQQFQFISDLTARGKQCLRELPVKFANLSTYYDTIQKNN
ncbi:MAG: mechanosensitive ion channel protein MscS [Candidatus Cloacimonas sp. SDB]|nr:MAG: mechanosensitive ion channel protein MscS [Candidatus Cloacimonas sp. SDB]